MIPSVHVDFEMTVFQTVLKKKNVNCMYLRTFDIFTTFNINYAVAFLSVEVGTARYGTKLTFFNYFWKHRATTGVNLKQY